AHHRRRDGLAVSTARLRRPRPRHPAPDREPASGGGHGPRGPQARGGGVLPGHQARPHRGIVPPSARRQALRLMAGHPTYRLLWRLWPFLRPYLHWLVIGSSLALVVSSAEGFIAWLVKPALDEIFLKRDVAMLRLIPLMLLGAYLVKGIGRYGQAYLMAAVGERVIARIRDELYRHIQGMSLSFYSQMPSAELMPRVVNDVTRLARLASTVLVMTVRQVATIVALLAVMFIREWVLALIAVIVFPAVGVLFRTLG